MMFIIFKDGTLISDGGWKSVEDIKSELPNFIIIKSPDKSEYISLDLVAKITVEKDSRWRDEE